MSDGESLLEVLERYCSYGSPNTLMYGARHILLNRTAGDIQELCNAARVGYAAIILEMAIENGLRDIEFARPEGKSTQCFWFSRSIKTAYYKYKELVKRSVFPYQQVVKPEYILAGVPQ